MVECTAEHLWLWTCWTFEIKECHGLWLDRRWQKIMLGKKLLVVGGSKFMQSIWNLVMVEGIHDSIFEALFTSGALNVEEGILYS